MLETLFENFVQSGGQWRESQILVQMQTRFTGTRKGARRWMTRKEIMKKYDGDAAVAEEIIKKKETDPALKRTCCRDHPEPGLKTNPEYRQYLCWDEEYETEQEDQILTKLCGFANKDDHSTKEKKDGREKAKKKGRKRSSSSKSTSQSESMASSDDTTSSSHKRKTTKKKDKKEQKGRKGKKSKKDKRAKSKSKKVQKKAKSEETSNEAKSEEDKRDEDKERPKKMSKKDEQKAKREEEKKRKADEKNELKEQERARKEEKKEEEKAKRATAREAEKAKTMKRGEARKATDGKGLQAVQSVRCLCAGKAIGKATNVLLDISRREEKINSAWPGQIEFKCLLVALRSAGLQSALKEDLAKYKGPIVQKRDSLQKSLDADKAC